MQITLTLEFDEARLAELLAAYQAQGHPSRICVHSAPAPNPCRPEVLEDTTIRALLTQHGLTSRQCDLVLLDVEGYTRADIAARCGISPATVKKYWAAIYATLGIQRRQTLRAWLHAHVDIYGVTHSPVPLPDATDCPPNHPRLGDYVLREAASMLEARTARPGVGPVFEGPHEPPALQKG